MPTSSSCRDKSVPRLLKNSAIILLATTAYAAAAIAGVRCFIFGSTEAAVVWPASGVLLSVLLLVRRELWPWLLGCIFVTIVASNYVAGFPLTIDVVFGIVNCLEPLAGAVLLGRWFSRLTFGRLSHVFGFVAVCAMVGLPGSVIGAIAMHDGSMPVTLIRWWLADFVGMVVFGSLILSWAQDDGGHIEFNKWKPIEIVLFLMVFGSISYILLFLPGDPFKVIRPSVVVYPFLMWTALRFGPRCVTAVGACGTTMAVFATRLGLGVFAQPTLTVREQILGLQAFWVVALITPLAVAAILTERNRVVQALQESEADARRNADELAAVMDVAPAVTLIAHDSACSVVTGNRIAEKFHGAPSGGNNRRSALSPDVLLNFRAYQDGRELAHEELPLQIAAATGREVRDCEMTFVFNDGTSRDVFGNTVPLFSDSGRVRGAVGVFLDITASRRAQRALRESEQRVRTFFNQVPLGLVVVDLSGAFVEVNPAFCSMLGYSETELKQLHVSDITYPEDRDATGRVFQAVNDRERRIANMEKRYIRKDGSVIWGFVHVSWIFDDAGHPINAIVLVRNITEEKLAANELRDSQERLKVAVEAGGMIDWEWNLRSGRFSCSERVRNLYGDSLEQMQTFHDFLAIVHPEDRQKVKGAVDDAIKSASAYEVDCRAAWPDGTYHWIANRGKGFHENGVPSRLVGVTFDISERIRNEEALRKSQDRLKVTAEAAGIIDWEWDLRTGQTTCSEQLRSVYGLGPEEFLSFDRILAIIHPDDRAEVQGRLNEAIKNASSYELQCRAFWPDGTLHWVESKGRAFHEDGSPSRILGITVDISERKRSEEALRISEDKLRQALKMEAIGQLAGGIAHDFNNVLMVISSYSELLTRECTLPDQQRKLQQIIKASERAASMTQQLLAFSRKQLIIPTKLELNDWLRDFNGIASRLVGEDIHITLNLSSTSCDISVDKGQLQQLVMNLLANARDAMPTGGSLVISTHRTTGQKTRSRKLPQSYVQLTVSDTGCGIDPAMLPHIFEPFFTTKDVGKGTGLGLATVYGIVKQNQGEITVESEPGKGTSFIIQWPEVQTRPDNCNDMPAAVPANASGTILVVEDEEALRSVISNYLSSQGYSVLSAADAMQACTLANGKNIDLLVTDVVMPGQSGADLYKALTTTNRNLRAIFLSGYSERRVKEYGLESLNVQFVQKPIRLKQLDLIVRETLVGCAGQQNRGAHQMDFD